MCHYVDVPFLLYRKRFVDVELMELIPRAGFECDGEDFDRGGDGCSFHGIQNAVMNMFANFQCNVLSFFFLPNCQF